MNMRKWVQNKWSKYSDIEIEVTYLLVTGEMCKTIQTVSTSIFDKKFRDCNGT